MRSYDHVETCNRVLHMCVCTNHTTIKLDALQNISLCAQKHNITLAHSDNRRHFQFHGNFVLCSILNLLHYLPLQKKLPRWTRKKNLFDGTRHAQRHTWIDTINTNSRQELKLNTPRTIDRQTTYQYKLNTETDDRYNAFEKAVAISFTRA